MPSVVFFQPAGSSARMRDLIEVIRFELGRQDVPTSVSAEFTADPRPDLLYGLASPAELITMGQPLSDVDPVQLRRTVVIADELPVDANWPGPAYAGLLRRCGAAFHTNAHAALALNRRGIATRTLRPGYSELRDRYDPERERPVDVLILAETGTAKAPLALADLAPLTTFVWELHLEEPVPVPGVPVRTLSEAMAEAKIVIDARRPGTSLLDWDVMLTAFHTGAVLLTSRSAGSAPFEAGRHLVVGHERALPHLAAALLRDDARRSVIAAEAYARLRSWLPYELSIGVLRALLVELVGHPAPASAPRPAQSFHLRPVRLRADEGGGTVRAGGLDGSAPGPCCRLPVATPQRGGETAGERGSGRAGG
jgi:hypothetical protein